KQPKEAAEFISWILAGDPEIMESFFVQTRFSKFPARKSVDDLLNQNDEAKNDPWRKLIAEQVIPYVVNEPIYAWEISMAYANAVERVTLQGQSIEDALVQAE